MENEIIGTFGSLVIVLVIIFLLANILRRFQTPLNNHATCKLKIISQIHLGTKERIAIIEVGVEQLLVGITGNSITLLTKLEEKIEISSNNTSHFDNYLSKFIKKNETK